MISVANLLVDTHRIRLGRDCIDKQIFLRMSKSFMERARRKENFTSIMFHDDLSDEHASSNEEWKY